MKRMIGSFTGLRALLGAVVVALGTALALASFDAQAKRVGSGKSVGKQSNMMQRDAAPATPAAPAAAPGQKQASPAAAPAANAAAQSQRSRWLGPIAGLAAGLGLAALASYLGFGEELASFLLIALLVVAAIVVVRMVMARRQAPRTPAMAGAAASQGNSAYAAIGQEAGSVGYRPEAATAGGAERNVYGAAIGSGAPVSAAPTRSIPEGFDVEGFVRSAKAYFIRLQAASDAGNELDLKEFTSPGMFAELKLQIAERAGAESHTEVMMLEAQLLGIDSDSDEHLASVRFTGTIREDGGPTTSLDEVWNFTRPVSGRGGWVLAGIEQLA